MRITFLLLVVRAMGLLGGLTVLTDPSAFAAESTGRSDPRLIGLDRLLTKFLREHELPGAALAIARNGRLIYARGFGYADRAANELVQPQSLFRIASISKPITAVAILQLVERERLKLDDRVFELLQLQHLKGEGNHFDPRWKEVTILQLLQHRGGWDGRKSFDPMFRSRRIVKELLVRAPARPEDIIHYMLHQPLDFDPGERFAYSNFGYCLLGRVIEKVSGRAYEEYVRAEVLAPLGIYNMRLGKTLPVNRARGEVRYYVPKSARAPAVMGPRLGKRVLLPYGAWCLESMDAHGGWLASAADLVRFASAFDKPSRCKILKRSSIQLMFAPPPGLAGVQANGAPRAAYYACGWMVRPFDDSGRADVTHSGSLPGTSTILTRRHDGIVWAVLFNSRYSIREVRLSVAIEPRMRETLNAVSNWPHGQSLLR